MRGVKLDPKVSIGGTFRVGTYHSTCQELIAALGEPHERYGDKTSMEWYFETPAGPATLYDYHMNGVVWSIGGYTREAADYLTDHLNGLLKRK